MIRPGRRIHLHPPLLLRDGGGGGGGGDDCRGGGGGVGPWAVTAVGD